MEQALLQALSGQEHTLTIQRVYLMALKVCIRRTSSKTYTDLDSVPADYETALFLGQVLWWSAQSPEGWVCKSYAVWSDETALTAHQVRTCIDKLCDYGVLAKKTRHAGSGVPTLHVRPCWDVLMPLLSECATFGRGADVSCVQHALFDDVVPEERVVQPALKKPRVKRSKKTLNAVAKEETDPVKVWRAYIGYNLDASMYPLIRETVTDIQLLKHTLAMATDKRWNPRHVGNILRAYREREALAHFGIAPPTNDREPDGVFIGFESEVKPNPRLQAIRDSMKKYEVYS